MSRPRVAAIVTAYYPHSHADVILTKLLKGIPADDGMRMPQLEIVSMYLDQVHERDMGVDTAAECDVPIYASIVQALQLGGEELAVDGVVIIAEHGDYAWNEKEQHLYPRRHFFEQVAGVFAVAGRTVPVFCDKHMSWSWDQAKWMYDRARSLKVPLMVGSSISTCHRDPPLELDLDTPMEEAFALGYGGLDAYGFHTLEALQCMVERRTGGETGIAAVQCLEGAEVWKARDRGEWSWDLATAAAEVVEEGKAQRIETECADDAVLFLLEYRDGLRAAALLANGYKGEVHGWSFAGRCSGEIQSTYYVMGGDPYPHFTYQCLNIERLIRDGIEPYPPERTLLTGGALEALLDSRHQGHVRIDTPHLDVAYRSYETPPERPSGTRPTGAAAVPLHGVDDPVWAK
ncbi:MAG: hypothetical protein HN712_02175 [Gemmatimonadetes bacterium]|nr:hypothetical protein [Gemmatimonadota bacterium]MBT6150339.1 hypothetical protein [Gemmatimonadota bacterium]MBT7859082.1 hypothetical protein [Gemmatimonadota bacterium]